MNPELVKAGLQLLLGSIAFIRELRSDDAALNAIVEEARRQGRQVDISDVKDAVKRMHSEGDALTELIGQKKADLPDNLKQPGT